MVKARGYKLMPVTRLKSGVKLRGLGLAKKRNMIRIHYQKRRVFYAADMPCVQENPTQNI
jgi:hypothetical protein